MLFYCVTKEIVNPKSKLSLVTALDAFGICFESMRDIIQKNDDNMAKGLEMAIQMIRS